MTVALLYSAVGLYSDDVDGPIMVMRELESGVTHMIFSPSGDYLYTGYRKVFTHDL